MANISNQQQQELVSAVIDVSRRNNWDPADMLTIMSFETGGTLDPWQPGPTTKWGQHRGLIQWGGPQARQYGVSRNTSIARQVEAAAEYMKDRGVQPGDGILPMYASINAGHASRTRARDAAAGGTWGTVADKVNHQMGGHRTRADNLLSRLGPNPATMNRFSTGFSVSPNQIATTPTGMPTIDGVARPSMINRQFAAVPTPSFRNAQTPAAARGYVGPNSPAGSLANAEWAGTNLSGTSFGLPPSFTSRQALRDVIPAVPVTPVTRAPLRDLGPPSPAGLNTLSRAVAPATAATSALGSVAPAARSLASSALAAAPVGVPALGLAAASRNVGLAAPNAVTAAPVSVPDIAISRRTGIAKTDEQVREEGRARDRAARGQTATRSLPNDPLAGRLDQSLIDNPMAGIPAGSIYNGVNAPGRSRFGVNPGTVTGGLLGLSLAGPIGGLLGAVIGGGGLRGIGEGLGGMFSGNSNADNSGSFAVANPAGGRGLMDLSGGPVSLGSITAAPTPSSGGYRSTDSATGWSSYSNPTTGITTTFDANGNTLGGPGMAPDVGGNSPGGKG